ncbi:MAG: hypothetical protein WC708_01930 [Lentisphaeria bacterium]
MKIKSLHVWLVVLALCVCAIPFRAQLRRPVVAVSQSMKGKKTVSDRVSQYGDAVRARLGPQFASGMVTYPPRRVTLVGLKAERTIQVWVSGDDGKWTHLRDYPILGMSGVLGPKLKEGDLQVPEGLYGVESLNPNSLYHLALRLNYPNNQDRLRGKKDGRSELGSDIMIHGKTCSIGCLAMGDEAAEDLFVLVAETGIDNVSIILAPVDFRTRELPELMPATPPWGSELYDTIKKELWKLGGPTSAGRVH